jgi:NAD(P)H dehydrogenase (quinone)
VSDRHPILVTGAAGKVGGVGRTIVEVLRQRDLPVRAFVRTLDQRSEALSAMGAEVFVGELTQAADVARALKGCRRMYFGMSVSPPYLEATVTAAAAALAQGDLEVFVNISQMTVSQMSLLNMTDSPQQRLHWLAEQALNWSGLPVVHVRATVFLEHYFFSSWAASSIAKDGTIRLPFGSACTSPIAVRDVAQVVATALENPVGHIGKIYELTGPESMNMAKMADEYSAALGRPVKYVDTPFDEWREKVLRPSGLPEHVMDHFAAMAKLHKDNRYDRMTRDVETVTGGPALSVKDYVSSHPELFKR